MAQANKSAMMEHGTPIPQYAEVTTFLTNLTYFYLLNFLITLS